MELCTAVNVSASGGLRIYIDPYLTSPLLQNPGGATGWRRGVLVSGVRRMNKVNARRARLVLGRVTVFGRVCYIGM